MKEKNTRLFIKVPRGIIESFKDSWIGVIVYLAIAISYGLNKKAVFTLEHFAEFANKSASPFTKKLLINSLTELQNQNRIDFSVDNNLFTVNVLDGFNECKTFAKIYTDEIYMLHQEPYNKKTYKLLYMLAYLRLNMNDKGLFYRTYTKIAKSLNISDENVSRLCRTLQDLNIISIKLVDNGKQPDHTYKSNAKFEIFADKSNPDWQTNLKNLETQLAIGIDDDDLW